ncbi:MAG: type I methionyl aminopeptidase, partial [Vicinamibacterales bacterium]
DWNGLRRAGRVVRMTLDALERHLRPGITTGELDAVARRVLDADGARSAPALVYGFPGTVLISVNDEIVHGVPGPRRIAEGDLVKLDVTVEKNGYVADAARTVAVGPPSDLAARLIASAEAAFHAGCAVARAGTRVSEIGRAVDREVRRRGFAVVKGLTGHGVGRTIHEPPSVPNEYHPWQRDILTEGLVLTIEPMVSAGTAQPVEDKNNWTIRTSDGSLSSHFEQTIVITRDAPIVLTAA